MVLDRNRNFHVRTRAIAYISMHESESPHDLPSSRCKKMNLARSSLTLIDGLLNRKSKSCEVLDSVHMQSVIQVQQYHVGRCSILAYVFVQILASSTRISRSRFKQTVWSFLQSLLGCMEVDVLQFFVFAFLGTISILIFKFHSIHVGYVF